MTAKQEPRVVRRRVGAVAIAAVAVDWSAKWLATTRLDDEPEQLGAWLTLRLSHNSGVAFSLGDSLPAPVIVAATAAVTIAIAVSMVRGLFGPWWAGGLVLGGAVANLGDRLLGGTVVDFLDLGWWPSFNLADVWLTTGALAIIVASLLDSDDAVPDNAAGELAQPR